MLTGESLEQLHADLTALALNLRACIHNSQATLEQSAPDAIDRSFERGRQAGLFYALSKVERALEEAS